MSEVEKVENVLGK